MKVIIDRNLCHGHGRCYMLAPDVFSADGEGYSVLLHEELPPELEAQARTAERNCPECAIRLVGSAG
jgi:ferredoxin